MEEIKRIDIKEFREKGYLQEVNRRFFHPLGLALEVRQEADGTEELGGIWDYRDDKEGMYYDIQNSNLDRKNRFKSNKEFIDYELEKRSEERIKLFENNIEPIK